MECFFVTDLHGASEKYKKLFRQIEKDKPETVFIGGDLLAHGFFNKDSASADFITDVLTQGCRKLKSQLGSAYPHIFIIMGNDDPKSEEPLLLKYDEEGLWHYCNERKIELDAFTVFGYCYVPPSPFLLKDWERFDISRFVDIGCVPPTEGYHSTKFSLTEVENATIAEDLANLTQNCDLSKSVFLFHAPPYDTGLDRAALDGKSIDYAPLDVHVGSIAIRRFIEEKQPLITLHGHVHESFQLTGIWKQNLGRTTCLSAVGLGKPLILIKFNPENPSAAQRLSI